jgi:hypothetical protein
VFQHFQGMGSKDVWAGYVEERDPRAMLFIPLSGLGTTDSYRNLLDRLDLSGIVMSPYGDRTVRYMPEWVLRQFGRVQTISRHPVEVAPPETNLGEISLRFQRALDHTLTPEQLGQRVIHGVEATYGYIE